MRFVPVRELRGKSAQIWRELSGEREMIITSNGKPIAILSAVPASDLEETLKTIRRARAIAAVTALQLASAARPSAALRPDEIDDEIRAARKGRPR
jgi:antitoxin (DNA-binding transcriptional repressor) of toxin-antitoxin stability system